MLLLVILFVIKLSVQVNILKNCGEENESVGKKIKKKKKENRTFVTSKVSKLKIMTLKANYEISEIDHDKVICVLMAWSSMKMISGLIQKKN